MADDKYSVSYYSVNSILSYIEAGEIAIPEIQRPFVWSATQVRDLIDSLYNGFPTGYLIIWQNPSIHLKDGTSSIGKKILIDGQQRITALMTAISGKSVLTEDYSEKTIKIAFNPLAQGEEERFAVQTPIHLRSNFWIPNIAEIFKPDFSSFAFITNYLRNNPDANQAIIEKAIEKLQGIKTRTLGAITLVPELDVNEVTEIFVRVNSQGKRLNEADFAMSKIAADSKHGGNLLRKAIDYFCHLATAPSFYQQIASHDDAFMKSEYAPLLAWLKNDYDDTYDPDYTDMLRVSFMHMIRRGRLADLVSLLSGRDFERHTYKEEIAEKTFSQLAAGVKDFMKEYSFKQFILAIRSAGFCDSKLLNSKITLDFAYALYLLLVQDGTVPKIEIKRCIQKWFVLTTLTGRYVGSPESWMDRDLHSIAEKGFIPFLDEIEKAELSDSFWDVGLVQALETSSGASPYFCVFIAAQVFFADNSLFSTCAKISDLIGAGDVHHIFPKHFLKKNGITEKSVYNQIANYTYLDTGVNIAIGESAPAEYFKKAFEQCDTGMPVIGTIPDKEQLRKNLAANCIPESICSMTIADYPEFLKRRRHLMARRIKDYYFKL